jgi:protein-S-isoprenylcysteine O-methyltransferase Ste14
MTMATKRTGRLILGYLIGGFVFLVLIPLGLRRASWAFDHMIGIQLVPFTGLRCAIALSLAVVGIAFALWSNIVQNAVGKGGPLEVAGMEVSPKTQNLVITGPYRYTRNPMLFGACVYYYAVATYLNSVTAVAVTSLFMVFMLILVKLTEEPRLLREFGNDYAGYRRRVSMFIPWRQKQSGLTNT